MRKLVDWYEAQSPAGIAVVCLALVAVFAAVDRLAPPEVTFRLFYALIVGLAGWGGGKSVGALVALAAAMAAELDEWINYAGHMPPSGILVWNAFARFGVYLLLAALAAALRGLTRSLSQKIRQRTAELESEIGSHRQTEAQLRESVLQFRQLSEGINAVFWMSDPRRLRMFYVSPAYERIWGRSCQSLYDAPDSWLQSIHPEDRLHIQAEFSNGQNAGGYDAEYRIVAPQGEIRWIHDRAFPIRDGQGDVFRIAGIAEDITDWKLAAEALHVSENRYRSLVESAQDVIFTLAPDGTFSSLNAAFETLTGWPRAEWIGRSFTELLTPADLSLAVTMAQRVLGGERTPLIEVRVKTTSGSQVVAQVTGVPEFSKDHIVGVLGIARDVTELKRAEAERYQSEERFRLAMDATSDGLWEWDVTTGRTYFSPAYFRMLGYEPNVFPSNFHTWVDLVHPKDREHALTANQDCIENRRDSFQAEFRMRAKDGAWRWILGRGKAVKRDAKGKALLMVGTHEDITLRKQAEEALRQSEARFRSLFENMPVGFAYCRMLCDGTQPRDWVYLEVNTAFERLSGLNDVVGKKVSDLLPRIRETNPDLFEIYGRVASAGNPEQFETFVSSLERWFSVAVYSPQKEHFVSIFDNITERKRVEEMLQTQGLVLDNMFDGVILLDQNAIIRLTNPTLDAMFGYARGELLGRHISVLNSCTAEESARLAEELIRQVAAHRAYLCEFQNRRKDGSRFITEARISALTIGGKLHYVSVQRDITDKKRLETQILEVSDREQARIGQDLHDGLCQRLVSAGFDINRLEQRLAAAALPETKVAHQIADVVDGAITEARAIARGLFPVQLEADGLSAALQELAASVNAHTPIKCRALCPGPPLVRDNTVATHLYRIAQEAVNNAIKHSRARSIVIQLKTENYQIELTVTDDGAGMADPLPATGLGLHIMDYRARTIGGTLSISHPPSGPGTRVYCCAPQQIA